MPNTEIPQDGFMAEDFAEVARLLREYILADASDYSFRAVMSNNASTILAALDRASRAPDPSREGLVERAAVEKMLRDWQASMDAAGLVSEYNQGTVLLSRLDALSAIEASK